ncbi:hypothetical protein COW53_08510 [bacterium CG17_big_fil_post_rev_8_21_14_2_50_64_8]|nr:MAG: hypothetical protein COW53_08510 [bacterium CG17_big_fil_post_rev_8_21_14_2_50_64_8]PJA73890.1 MAG: hypothetical protein CO151_10910 [bacterium CG_4_9_14_3_um_filter_65_15]
MARKDDQLLQTGHRPSAGRNQRRGTPRAIWLALFVAMVAAFLLFRQPGGGRPTGIGENRSVITVPADDLDSLAVDLGIADTLDTDADHPAQPRSGQVEMQHIAQELTPEKPSGGQQETAPATTPSPRTTPPAPEPAREKPATKPLPEVQPEASGPYLVQTGSYGDAANADREALRLQKFDWDARVKVSSTADGAMIYRVRIGYFPDRGAAQAFIQAHGKQLRGAIAVHR